ncbi:MAG: late competence development ComFB family protein [Oscillospiraceae bacterium]|nr:late competence development ComFB family protein [Oscillospiraceae bacterium]
MSIVNIMEGFVQDKIEEMIANESCCKCERCIDDMKAIALNRLPAKYVSSHNGELFSKLDSMIRQNAVDINIAVAEAIYMVAKRPSH